MKTFIPVIAMLYLSGHVLAQPEGAAPATQTPAAQTSAEPPPPAQRRIELRHALQAQPPAAPAPRDARHQLTAQEREQLRQQLRQQAGAARSRP